MSWMRNLAYGRLVISSQKIHNHNKNCDIKNGEEIEKYKKTALEQGCFAKIEIATCALHWWVSFWEP